MTRKIITNLHGIDWSHLTLGDWTIRKCRLDWHERSWLEFRAEVKTDPTAARYWYGNPDKFIRSEEFQGQDFRGKWQALTLDEKAEVCREIKRYGNRLQRQDLKWRKEGLKETRTNIKDMMTIGVASSCGTCQFGGYFHNDKGKCNLWKPKGKKSIEVHKNMTCQMWEPGERVMNQVEKFWYRADTNGDMQPTTSKELIARSLSPTQIAKYKAAGKIQST